MKPLAALLLLVLALLCAGCGGPRHTSSRRFGGAGTRHASHQHWHRHPHPWGGHHHHPHVHPHLAGQNGHHHPY